MKLCKQHELCCILTLTALILYAGAIIQVYYAFTVINLGLLFFTILVIVGVVGLCLGISKSSSGVERNNNLEFDMHFRLGLGTAFLASGLTSYVVDSYRLTTNAATSQTGLGLDGFSILFVLLGIGMLYGARGLVKR